MTKQRPVFLNLLQIRFPITAIASILHRISGVVLFLLIPGFLWLYQHATQSAASFASLQQQLNAPICRLLMWLGLSALIYHLIAGVRHMIMDFAGCHSREGAVRSAGLSILLAVLVVIAVGVRLW